MANILVVDDHPIFRRGLVAVLTSAGHRVVAEAADGEAALATLTSRASTKSAGSRDLDVVVIDIGLPKLDGIGVIRAARRDGVEVPFVVLSLHNEHRIVREALAAGADGYVLKERAEQEVLGAIAAVLSGERFVSGSLAAILQVDNDDDDEDPLLRLTAAEQRVLLLLSNNQTSVEIAAALGLSVRTVQNHRARAANKLGLAGPNRLLQFALEHRVAMMLLTPSSSS